MTQSWCSSCCPSSTSGTAPLPGLASLRLTGCIRQHSISLGIPAAAQEGGHSLLASPHRLAGLWVLRWCTAGDSPLHDDEQTLPPLVEVLVDVHDADDVRALRRSPVQLHFPAGLRAVLQHLREKRDPVSPEPRGEPGHSAPLAQCPPKEDAGRKAKRGCSLREASRRAPAHSVQCLHPHLVGRARSHPPS